MMRREYPFIFYDSRNDIEVEGKLVATLHNDGLIVDFFAEDSPNPSESYATGCLDLAELSKLCQTIGMARMGKVVTAEAHSDDYAHNFAFDATPWFENAGGGEIIDLIKCGWGGDEPADRVALDLEDKNVSIAAMMKYCRASQNHPNADMHYGFEVHVDSEEATAWIVKHRPTLRKHLDL